MKRRINSYFFLFFVPEEAWGFFGTGGGLFPLRPGFTGGFAGGGPSLKGLCFKPWAALLELVVGSVGCDQEVQYWA